MANGQLASREGQRLKSKYLLEKLLGAGGMGEVYRARNTMVDRTVAIKLLHQDFATEKVVVERFLREAKAANLVRHPNVVEVLDIDTDESGVPFIVQEYLEGEDLSSRMEKHGNKMPILAALRLLLPVIKAVALAHSKGLVHRDLKPENIFLAWQNGTTVPKILDFGISKMPTKPNETRLTATGTVMGSPAYMSPEQIQNPTGVDLRSDIWALGIIIYEMLSGRLPFEASQASALFVKICVEEPVPLEQVAPNLPKPLYRIVKRCLQRSADDRYQSAEELVLDISYLLEQMRTSDMGPIGPDLNETLPSTAAQFRSIPEKPRVDTKKTVPVQEPKATQPYKKPATRSTKKSKSTTKSKNRTQPKLALASIPPKATQAARTQHRSVNQQNIATVVLPDQTAPTASMNLAGFFNIFLITLLLVAIGLSLAHLSPMGLDKVQIKLGGRAFMVYVVVALVLIAGGVEVGKQGFRSKSPGLFVACAGLIAYALCLAITSGFMFSPQSMFLSLRPLSLASAPWAAAAVPFGFAGYGFPRSKREFDRGTVEHMAVGGLLFGLSLIALVIGIRLAAYAFETDEPSEENAWNFPGVIYVENRIGTHR